MSDAEKIYVSDKVADYKINKIREENKLRQRYGRQLGGVNKQIAGNIEKLNGTVRHDRSTNTCQQRAKLSGLSSGTISRYDTVMKSGDEDLKQSMLAGDVKI